MAKWTIRDLWGKRTEKKALNPDMRNMLMSLDGVYEPRGSDDTEDVADREQEAVAPRQATG